MFQNNYNISNRSRIDKIVSNAWRYINFSISNQFYFISENLGIDFNKLRSNIMIEGYNRNKSMPKAGFAAGPCLYKDTAQLNALKFIYPRREEIKINQGFPKLVFNKIKKI